MRRMAYLVIVLLTTALIFQHLQYNKRLISQHHNYKKITMEWLQSFHYHLYASKIKTDTINVFSIENKPSNEVLKKNDYVIFTSVDQCYSCDFNLFADSVVHFINENNIPVIFLQTKNSAALNTISSQHKINEKNCFYLKDSKFLVDSNNWIPDCFVAHIEHNALINVVAINNMYKGFTLYESLTFLIEQR